VSVLGSIFGVKDKCKNSCCDFSKLGCLGGKVTVKSKEVGFRGHRCLEWP
jgi:hypothetical protein